LKPAAPANRAWQTGCAWPDALGADPRYLAFGEGDDPRSDVERRLTAIEQRVGLAS
jgi:hypothetical protein